MIYAICPPIRRISCSIAHAFFKVPHREGKHPSTSKGGGNLTINQVAFVLTLEIVTFRSTLMTIGMEMTGSKLRNYDDRHLATLRPHNSAHRSSGVITGSFIVHFTLGASCPP